MYQRIYFYLYNKNDNEWWGFLVVLKLVDAENNSYGYTVNEIIFNRLTNVFVLIIVNENHTADKKSMGYRNDGFKKR